MFGPLLDIWEYLKGLVPDSFKPGRPHFNFITVHCKRMPPRKVCYRQD